MIRLVTISNFKNAAIFSICIFILIASSKIGVAQTAQIDITLSDASIAATTAGAVNQAIVRVAISNPNGGGQGTCTVTQMNFTKALGAATANVTGAKLYYTISSSTFATTTQLGATDVNIDNGITFTFSQAMAKGAIYYYWLAYDISAGAATCTSFDATQVVTDITANATTKTYSDVATGSRTIVGPGCWQYCASTHSFTSYYLTNVTFNTINNTTTNTCGSMYCDYTGTSTTIIQGSSYNMTVTAVNGANPAYIYAYFDWNNNGSFLDAGESFNIGTSPAGGPTVIGPVSILVPAGASVGTTRMRIVMSRTDDALSPCNPHPSGYGETEGYSVQIIAPVNCSGTPPAGTISPATSNITTAQSVLLSWSEPPATGYTYQWQSGPSATGPWSNISGATSSTYNATGLSVGTIYFKLNVTCTLSGLSNSSATAQVNVTITYCAPGNLDCSLSDRITRVQLATLDNSSGATCTATTGYSDYSGVAAPTLIIGSSYSLSITVGAGTGLHSAGVWFDFNQNGSFLDPGEYYSIAQNTINPSTTTTVPILIPTTSNTGNLRMRIQYAFGSAVLSSWTCFTNATFGETEDYTVNIQCGATPSDVTGRFPANTLALPCGSAATLTWNPHTCATGFKVYMDTNPSPTTLVANSTSTNYYSGNLASNTTYYWKIVPYNGTGDGASSTWSFITQTAINTAISQDTSNCYSSGICVQASGGAFPDYYWYNVPVNGTPLATGTNYCPTGDTIPTTYYVSNVLQGAPTSINTATTSPTVCSGINPGFGCFFDVKAKSANVTVTSLSVMFRSLGGGGSSNRPVKVYYRTTSHMGSTGSSTGWTLIDNLSISVLNTPTAITPIDITDVFVPAGSTYGFYVVYDPALKTGAGLYTNTDVEIVTGAVACSAEFASVYPDVTFHGTVFYKISCSSPTTPVVVTPWYSSAQVKMALATVINAKEQCTESGWTYYANPAAKNDWLFAIKKNGNTFTADVDIVETPSVYSNINAPLKHGSFLISRYWNVRVTSGSVVTPVDVRYFFDTAEVRAAYDLRNFERTTNYPTSSDVAWRWFKSVGSDFNPAVGINGNNFTFSNITTTSVNNLTILGAPYTGYINNVPFVEFTGVPSFSGGTGGFGFSPNVGVLLPVKLLSFKANAENTTVNISWLTETEINNDYFTVEKSKDGINYEVLDLIKGNGTTNITISYKTIDKTPYKGVSYYRLKQTNYDGTSEYFDPVSVNMKRSFDDVSIHPNPVTGKGNLTFNSIIENEQNVYIVDISGRIVSEHHFDVVKGENKISFETAHLSKGMYFVRIGQSEDMVHLKFIKE